MKFCPACGFSLNDEDIFCGSCGFKLNEQKEAESVPFVQHKVPIQPVLPQNSSVPEKPKKKSKAILVILLVVLLLFAGIGVFLLVDGFGENNEDGNNTNDTTLEDSTDKSGNVISDKETETVWILKEIIIPDGGKADFSYDDKYNLEFMKSSVDDEEEVCIEFTFDSDGNLLQIKGQEGYSTALIEFTYDSDGNILSQAEIHDGEEYVRYEYFYDDKGNRISQKLYEEGILESDVDFSYDANGRCEKMTVYSGTEMESYFLYTYDKDGNVLLSEKYYPDGTLSYYDEYTYDSEGRMLTSVYGNGRRAKKYTYDKNGNLESYGYYSDEYSESSEAVKCIWVSVELPADQAKKVNKQNDRFMELILLAM